MSRIKEPKIGSNQLPDYKSPPSRIIRSLRKGYNNLRVKLMEKSSNITSLKGKLRDVTLSREDWKNEAKQTKADLKQALAQTEKLKIELENKKKNLFL
jgi:hypothetical protein